MTNKLAVIVKESGIDSTKAKVLLENFADYFETANDWEIKARAIVITDPSQTFEMQTARAGRLFLRAKRLHIERTRKQLKEQSLREGKAIDGIANVLKALIIPIEEHLERQEKFLEIRALEEAEQARIKAEKKAEAERLAKEKAERIRQEQIRKENERLKKEAKAREKKFQEEREKRQAEQKKAVEERLAMQEIARKEREEAKRKARVEKERQEAKRRKIEEEKTRLQEIARKEKERANKLRQEKAEAKRRAKAEAERRKIEEIQRKAKAEEERKRALAKVGKITCPYCHKEFGAKELINASS